MTNGDRIRQMSYDITFCNNDKCIHTECERHLKNVPKDRYISVGDKIIKV